VSRTLPTSIVLIRVPRRRPRSRRRARGIISEFVTRWLLSYRRSNSPKRNGLHPVLYRDASAECRSRLLPEQAIPC
jgi:hypothetical protein